MRVDTGIVLATKKLILMASKSGILVNIYLKSLPLRFISYPCAHMHSPEHPVLSLSSPSTKNLMLFYLSSCCGLLSLLNTRFEGSIFLRKSQVFFTTIFNLFTNTRSRHPIQPTYFIAPCGHFKGSHKPLWRPLCPVSTHYFPPSDLSLINCHTTSLILLAFLFY
jgi:hypothetical protein